MTQPACPLPGTPPRCPRCGTPLRRAELPPGAFGLPGEPCVECNDAAPGRPVPWACPKCGAIWVLDATA